MNWDQVKGQWEQVKGTAKTKWGQLTDDELTQLAGRKDRLIGKLQEKYGLGREEAERQAEQFAESLR